MPKRKRPERAPEGMIYLIRHAGSDLHKIGITLDWARRSKQLEIGEKVQPVKVSRVLSPGKLERDLHTRFAAQRLPQSEWFHLSEQQVQLVLHEFASHEAKYKAWVNRLKTPNPPHTRKPQPYRYARLSSEATGQASRQPEQVMRVEQADRYSTRKPAPPLSRDIRKSEPIGIGGSVFLGFVFSSCFPILGFIFMGFGGSTNSLFTGWLIQSIVIASLLYRQNR